LSFRILVCLASACVAVTLTGCNLTDTGMPVAVAGQAIHGRAMGGQQVLSGAAVSVIRLNNGSTTTLESGVVTDANGNFSLTGSYTCRAPDQIYVLVRGGNPGLAAGTNNAALALVSALGTCPAFAGDLSVKYPQIVVNEATTVAMSYALAQFMTGPTTAGFTAQSTNTIPSAFLTAQDLVNPLNGYAPANTVGGNGAVPYQTINTLANILSACVNSDGTSMRSQVTPSGFIPATPCYTLFNASANRAGTLPTDTFTAMLNIAKNPSQHLNANNSTFTMQDLYGLQAANGPFQPSLTTQPTDLTLDVVYTGGGLSGTQTRPRTVAVGVDGNIWTINSNPASVSLFNRQGGALSPATGWNGLQPGFSSLPAFVLPVSLAAVLNGGNNEVAVIDQGAGVATGNARSIDVNGNVGTSVSIGGLVQPTDVTAGSGSAWITGAQNQLYLARTPISSATTLQTFSGNGLNNPSGVTLDPTTFRVYVANAVGNTVSAFKIDGTVAFAPVTTGDSGVQSSIATDGRGYVWVGVVSSNGNNTTGVTQLSATGVVATGSPWNDGQHVNHANSVVVDGAGNVWVAEIAGSPIYELSGTGTPLSGGGYVSDVQATSISIDQAGNIWFRNANDSTLRELIGLAAPTQTPITVLNSAN